MLKNFQTLPLINTAACRISSPNVSGISLIKNYPNPFASSTTITFTTGGGHTMVQIIDATGRVIQTLVDKDYPAGTFNVVFKAGALSAGVYYARLQNLSVQQVRAMFKAE